jgi:hypothetical protein
MHILTPVLATSLYRLVALLHAMPPLSCWHTL